MGQARTSIKSRDIASQVAFRPTRWIFRIHQIPLQSVSSSFFRTMQPHQRRRRWLCSIPGISFHLLIPSPSLSQLLEYLFLNHFIPSPPLMIHSLPESRPSVHSHHSSFFGGTLCLSW